MRYLIIALLILLSACSFKSPENQWQYDSTNAFNMYKQDFLSGNTELAVNDMQRAIIHAKKSADLTQLASIYLGKCALNISVGINDRCKEYRGVSNLVHNDSLFAYYSFLTSQLKQEQLENLDKRYKTFSSYYIANDFTNAENEIYDLEDMSSKLLASALLKEHLSEKTLEYILDLSSFHGYKKAVLFWLHEKLKRSNAEERSLILKKIDILKNN